MNDERERERQYATPGGSVWPTNMSHLTLPGEPINCSAEQKTSYRSKLPHNTIRNKMITNQMKM